MKIKLDEINTDGLFVEFEEDGADILGLALVGAGEQDGSDRPVEYEFLSPVSVKLDITRTESSLFVNGTLACRLSLQCGRCLKGFLFPVDTEFSYISLGEEGEDKGAGSFDLELTHIEDGELNVTELLLEQITLEVPTVPICSNACKGLCPGCGTDLNAGKCDCSSKEKIDPRLAKLKEFSVK